MIKITAELSRPDGTTTTFETTDVDQFLDFYANRYHNDALNSITTTHTGHDVIDAMTNLKTFRDTPIDRWVEEIKTIFANVTTSEVVTTQPATPPTADHIDLEDDVHQ